MRLGHGRGCPLRSEAHVITIGASHRGAIGKMLEGMGVAGSSDMVTSFTRERPAA